MQQLARHQKINCLVFSWAIYFYRTTVGFVVQVVGLGVLMQRGVGRCCQPWNFISVKLFFRIFYGSKVAILQKIYSFSSIRARTQNINSTINLSWQSTHRYWTIRQLDMSFLRGMPLVWNSVSNVFRGCAMLAEFSAPMWIIDFENQNFQILDTSYSNFFSGFNQSYSWVI